MTKKELSDKIYDIIDKSAQHRSGYISFHSLGLKEEDCPLICKYGKIELRVTDVKCFWVVVSVYLKGCVEGCDYVRDIDLPQNILKEVYNIVKKNIK